MSYFAFWTFALSFFFALVGFVYDVPLFQAFSESAFWICFSLFMVSTYLTIVRNSKDSGGSFIGFIVVMFAFGISISALASYY